MQTAYDKNYSVIHLGEQVKFRSSIHDLDICAVYFKSLCRKYGVKASHDCTADEGTYYKTLNFTNYAGMFMMHPLDFASTIFQMWDAVVDNCQDAGHLDWVKNNLISGTASKYINPDDTEMQKSDMSDVAAVVVLPGTNKWHTISRRKLKLLDIQYGKSLVIKPHPITHIEKIDDFLSEIKHARIAGKQDDLYSLISLSEKVYTTHISESALTSLLLGKKIAPIDKFGARLVGSFSHINNFLFTEKDPLPKIARAFASPKSGILHPDIDSDWKLKMEEYFAYQLQKRKLQRNLYCE